MNTDVLIALSVGIVLLIVLFVLYAKGDLPKMKTLGRVLTIAGGVAAFYGALID